MRQQKTSEKAPITRSILDLEIQDLLGQGK